MSEELMIGQVAKRSGLRSSALRYYESVGLLTARRVSGQRRYNAEDVQRLKLIRFAQGIGFSLDEIRALLDGFPQATPPSTRWQTFAPGKLAEIEAIIRQAEQTKALLEKTLLCECPTLADCATLCEPSS